MAARFLGLVSIVKEDKLKTAAFVMLLLFYGIVLTHEIKLPAADDLGRHIKNGEVLLSGNFDVLYENVYSYTEPDHVFANHHWLFGVLAYLLHESVKFEGIVVFKVLVMLIAFGLLFRLAVLKSHFWLAAALAIPTILVLMERTGFRPEIISYLFVAIYLTLLEKHARDPHDRLVWLLVPLQVIWVNTHIFFAIGIAIAGVFLFERLILSLKTWRTDALIRNAALLLLALAVVSCLNPHGIRGATLAFPLNIKGESPITIIEDYSIPAFLAEKYYLENISLALFYPLVAVLIISLMIGFRRRLYMYGGLSLASAALAYLHLRGIGLFGIFFLPTVAANLSPAYEWATSRARRVSDRAYRILSWLGALIVLLVIAAAAFYTARISDERYLTTGIGLVAWADDGGRFFNENELRGPVFNDADVGSYLIYHLYPHERVFVDNRFADAYSPEFFREEYLPLINNESVWQHKQQQYGFNTIFLYQYDRVPGLRDFIMRRMQDPAWAVVHIDVHTIIFVRDIPEHRQVIERYRITKSNAPERLAPILRSENPLDRAIGADVLFLFGLTQRAMDVYLTVADILPNRGHIWMIMGEIELMYDIRQRSERGVEYLERAIALGQRSAEAYTFLGLGYLRLGEYERGRMMLEKALEINPYRSDAKNYLNQLEEHLKTRDQ